MTQADYKALLKERLTTLHPYPSDRFSGKGIVICAGGPELFTNAYILVHILRVTHRCALPIEVWHFGCAEISGRMKLLLRELGVDTVDAEGALAAFPAAVGRGWQLKAYALMWSRFEQVLMLDADQVPVRDPSELFDWDCYRQCGAVFWPDIVDILPTNPAWNACDLPPRALPAMESGQILIHKSSHWAAMQMALHLNEHSAYYHKFLYGDKDTFLFGLLLTGERYALLPHRPFSDAPFCLYQRDIQGEPLFQHRTGTKWNYSGSQVELPGFVLVDECLSALTHLRTQWNGLVFTPPSRSLRAREAESLLAAARVFDFVCPGEPAVRLEFLAEGDFGAGRGADRMNWHCEEINGEIELLISNAFCPEWRLRRKANGHWHGRAEQADCEVHLAEKNQFRSKPSRAHVRTLAGDILSAAGFPSPAWIANGNDLLRVLRLIAAIEPQIGEVLVAAAECAGPLTDTQRKTLEAMARTLQPLPRKADRISRWPMPGDYSTETEFEI